MKIKNKKGFTLVEILIVIVILGVLAGLAIPIYTTQVRRSYRIEALNHLSATRSALANFQSMNNTYVGSTYGNPLSATAIGYDPAVLAGQTARFTYAISGQTATTYTVTATGVAIAPLTTADTVIVNQAGTITGTLT